MQKGLKDGFDGNLTEDVVAHHILLHILSGKGFPNEDSGNIASLLYEHWKDWGNGIEMLLEGEIEPTTLLNKKWVAVEVLFRGKDSSLWQFERSFWESSIELFLNGEIDLEILPGK